MKIHPSAIVHPKAILADDVEVGPFSIIGENVTIGSGTRIMSSVVIEGWTTIGCNNVIYPGAVIGAAPQDYGYKGERAFVKVGDDNILREYVTIHRAANEDGCTTVGNGNMLMANVHVAHNCTVGNQVTMANYVGMAGHSSVDDQAVLGGLAGLHQHVRVGRLCMVGGLSKVNKDLAPFTIVDGNPMHLYGLNFVGMRRRGISDEARLEVKRALAIVTSGIPLSKAVARIQEELQQFPEVQEFAKFLSIKSRMGVLTRSACKGANS